MSGQLLLKTIQLLEMTLAILAIGLLVGNGGKLLSNVWADEITGTEGDDNLLGTIKADTINGLDGDDRSMLKMVKIK